MPASVCSPLSCASLPPDSAPGQPVCYLLERSTRVSDATPRAAAATLAASARTRGRRPPPAFYIGYTRHLARRLREHHSSTGGCRTTRRYRQVSWRLRIVVTGFAFPITAMQVSCTSAPTQERECRRDLMTSRAALWAKKVRSSDHVCPFCSCIDVLCLTAALPSVQFESVWDERASDLYRVPRLPAAHAPSVRTVVERKRRLAQLIIAAHPFRSEFLTIHVL